MSRDRSWHFAALIFFAVGAVICGVLAYISGPSWSGVLDAFLCGFNVAGAIYTTMYIRIMESVDGLRVAYGQMADLNAALIAGRVKMHIEGMGDEPPPTQPRMH